MTRLIPAGIATPRREFGQLVLAKRAVPIGGIGNGWGSGCTRGEGSRAFAPDGAQKIEVGVRDSQGPDDTITRVALGQQVGEEPMRRAD